MRCLIPDRTPAINRTHSRPRLTVLMPLKHYHWPFLQKALASLLAQTCPHWRCLVIVLEEDREEFQALLQAYLRDARIRLIPSAGRNLAGQLNTGMRQAETAFVSILFGDDVWSTSTVEVLTAYIDTFPDVDFFHSSRIFIDADDRIISAVYRSRASFALADFVAGSPVKHLLCWRVQKALPFGGIDESLPSVGPDDYDFPWCMAERGVAFMAVEDCLYYYRDHRECYRLTTHLPLSVHNLGTIKILRKHQVRWPRIIGRLTGANRGYLRQCIYKTSFDKWFKELVGYSPRRGWREKYRQDDSNKGGRRLE
jgi:glycosyltransferase involved in cell wall biosynthesis